RLVRARLVVPGAAAALRRVDPRLPLRLVAISGLGRRSALRVRTRFAALRRGDQPLERARDGLPPHAFAVAVEMPPLGRRAVRTGPCEPDGPDRLLGRAAARAGDPADRD